MVSLLFFAGVFICMFVLVPSKETKQERFLERAKICAFLRS